MESGDLHSFHSSLVLTLMAILLPFEFNLNFSAKTFGSFAI